MAGSPEETGCDEGLVEVRIENGNGGGGAEGEYGWGTGREELIEENIKLQPKLKRTVDQLKPQSDLYIPELTHESTRLTLFKYSKLFWAKAFLTAEAVRRGWSCPPRSVLSSDAVNGTSYNSQCDGLCAPRMP